MTGRLAFDKRLYCQAVKSESAGVRLYHGFYRTLLMVCTSSVGPAIREVPVSAMAAHPLAHAVCLPTCTPCMLICQ